MEPGGCSRSLDLTGPGRQAWLVEEKRVPRTAEHVVVLSKDTWRTASNGNSQINRKKNRGREGTREGSRVYRGE